MLTLDKAQAASLPIEWDVRRGRTTVAENFLRGEVWLVMRSRANAYALSVTLSHTEGGGQRILSQVPADVEPGTYDFRLFWYKTNWRRVDESLPHTTSKMCCTEVPDALTVTDDGEANHRLPQRLRLRSATMTYGYDGLSAWETAVAYGLTTLPERQWVGNMEQLTEQFQLLRYELTGKKPDDKPDTKPSEPDPTPSTGGQTGWWPKWED